MAWWTEQIRLWDTRGSQKNLTTKHSEGMVTMPTPGKEEQRYPLMAAGSRYQKGDMCLVLQGMPGAQMKWGINIGQGFQATGGWSGDGGVKNILWHSSPNSGHKPQKQGKPGTSLSYSGLKSTRTSRQRPKLGRGAPGWFWGIKDEVLWWMLC